MPFQRRCSQRGVDTLAGRAAWARFFLIGREVVSRRAGGAVSRASIGRGSAADPHADTCTVRYGRQSLARGGLASAFGSWCVSRSSYAFRASGQCMSCGITMLWRSNELRIYQIVIVG